MLMLPQGPILWTTCEHKLLQLANYPSTQDNRIKYTSELFVWEEALIVAQPQGTYQAYIYRNIFWEKLN